MGKALKVNYHGCDIAYEYTDKNGLFWSLWLQFEAMGNAHFCYAFLPTKPTKRMIRKGVNAYKKAIRKKYGK